MNWMSPHESLVYTLEANGDGMDRAAATDLVNLMFDEFREPDRDMLDAGAAVLQEETLLSAERQRTIAERIWQAMLARAR